MNKVLVRSNPSLCKYLLTDRAILELYGGSLAQCERRAANSEGLDGVVSVEINSINTHNNSGSAVVTLAPVDRTSGSAGPPLRYELRKVEGLWRIDGLTKNKNESLKELFIKACRGGRTEGRRCVRDSAHDRLPG